MIYYQGYSVSFQEVPDEVSLVVLIGDCPYRCPGCHSPELQRPEGKDLLRDIDRIIDEYADAITCVCFMGEGQDPETLCKCAEIAIRRGFKTALYTGNEWKQVIRNGYRDYFYYIKTGAYIKALGGLDSKTTNQKFWLVGNSFDLDITYKFWKDYSK